MPLSLTDSATDMELNFPAVTYGQKEHDLRESTIKYNFFFSNGIFN